MNDKITIQDLEIFANHGVLPEENVLGQKFLVSITMDVDTKMAGKTDDLEKSVNYAQVAQFVTEIFSTHQWKLLETAAEYLSEQILLAYEKVNSVSLEIKKPWAPIGLPVDYVSVSVTRKWNRAYISIGSNMGDTKANLDKAIALLQEDSRTRVTKVADYIVTKPVGGVEQDDFLNSALEIETLRSPMELLELIAEIEGAMKRVRTVHWGPRVIDLDIVLYEDVIMDEEKLTIPHKEMLHRQFVLEPLSQIAPGAVHPYAGQTVFQLFKTLCQE